MRSCPGEESLQAEVDRLRLRLAELEAAESEKHKVREALQELNANLRALIENTEDFILLSDKEGRPVIFNSAYAKIMKKLLNLDMRPGIKPHTLVDDPGVQAFWENCHRRVLSGERFTVEVANPVPGGPEMWLEVRFNPVVKDGKIVGFSEFTRDITERKRAEQQQREYRDALEAEVARRTSEKVELERKALQAQKLESLGLLAGGIAHDFNNLLMTIMGNAELALLDLPDNSPARTQLRGIQQAARQAAELTNQMLAYAGKGKVSVGPVNLSKLIEEMRNLLEGSVSKKAILHFELLPSLPSVEADGSQMRQIVMNLVVNASEALGERLGEIRIRTSLVTLTDSQAEELSVFERLGAGDYVELEVADNGQGMEPRVVERIFEPFFTTKFTGRGLGLAAVQGIVRSARGTIQVTSQPGQGTTFRILLPALAHATCEKECPDSEDVSWQGSGCVLLVDDQASVRCVARAMLVRLGLEVLEASDGCQAIELMKTHVDKIDCVLLDLLMPTMDGEETLQELRRIRADLPVVLATGYDHHATSSRFADHSLAGFIQKPYSLGELQRVLRPLLSEEPN